MNKINYVLAAVFSLFFAFSCKTEKKTETSIVLSNGSSVEVTQPTTIKGIDKKEGFPELFDKHFVLYDEETAVPSQVVENPVSGEKDLIVQVNIPANSQKKLVVKPLSKGERAPEFEKKTQAELWHKEGGEFVDKKYVGGGPFVRTDYLRVPEGFMDHSYFIKYEGPGWESDKVGYRFYLDWRNAVDVFGKKVHEMVLNDVGQDGFDSYHEPAEWGQDILKVGKTLGIGTIGFWTGEKAIRVAETDSVVCKITEDGILQSQVRTNYYGWAIDSSKYSFASYITIDAGSRKSHEQMVFEQAPDNVCTGIIKDENAEFLQSSSGAWSYIATYGKQSLASDSLGLAVIYRTSDLIKNTEDEMNYVVVLKPENKVVSYYFLAAWEQEPGGIKSKEEFKKYLNEQLELLNNPVDISFSTTTSASISTESK